MSARRINCVQARVGGELGILQNPNKARFYLESGSSRFMLRRPRRNHVGSLGYVSLLMLFTQPQHPSNDTISGTKRLWVIGLLCMLTTVEQIHPVRQIPTVGAAERWNRLKPLNRIAPITAGFASPVNLSRGGSGLLLGREKG